MPRVIWLILLFTLPANAAVTVIQTNKASCPGTCTSLNIAYSSNITLHSGLLVDCYVNLSSGAGNGAATDTLGNTWVNIAGSGNPQATTLFVSNSLAGANTVTVTAPGTNFLSCQVYETSGLGTSPTITKFFNTGTSASMTVTGGSSSAGDWIFVGGFTDGSVAMTAGATYTLPASATQCGAFGFCSASEFKTSSGGAVTGSFTIGGSTDWGVNVFIFTPSASSSRKKSQIVQRLHSKKVSA